MEENLCKDCKYFIHHYGLVDGKAFRVYCGHCTKQISKSKKPDAKACASFVPRAQVEDEFVNKEYLSKKLLDYVLRMELLPNITDYPTNDE